MNLGRGIVARWGGSIVDDGISMRFSTSNIEAIREGESPRASRISELQIVGVPVTVGVPVFRIRHGSS